MRREYVLMYSLVPRTDILRVTIGLSILKKTLTKSLNNLLFQKSLQIARHRVT